MRSENIIFFSSVHLEYSLGDLRLVSNAGSTGGSSGRLEIYNFQWGTICDDLFSPMDADVACRQLGYAGFGNYGNVGTLG